MELLSYAATLKALLHFTETPSTQLAKYVEYDISYISKWTNGVKLPSSRSIDEINTKMGRYFAKLIIEHHRESEFCSRFALRNSDDLASEISQHLNAAYRNSIQKSTPLIESMPHTVLMTSGQNMGQLLCNLLNQKDISISEPQELIFYNDFCMLCDVDFWSGLQDISLDMPLNVYIGLNLHRIAETPNYLGQLYTILNKYISWDATIFPIESTQSNNFILYKNKFILQYTFLPNKDILCTCIENAAILQSVYEKCAIEKLKQASLLHSVKTFWQFDPGYRMSFYSTKTFFFFLTNGMEYLLPQEVFDNLQKQLPTEEKFIIEQLRTTWNEIVNTSQLHIVLPFSSLMEYLETGYIDLTEFQYRLSASERYAHIQYVLKQLERNTSISIGILTSSPNTIHSEKGNLSFYSNYKTSFFKKNSRVIPVGQNTFYMIDDSHLNQLFLNFFQQLTQTPQYHEYNRDELTQKYELYKPFIDKILNLSSSRLSDTAIYH